MTRSILLLATLVVFTLPLAAHAQPPGPAWDPVAITAAPTVPECPAITAAVEPSDPAPDPTEDPGGFIEAARDAFASGALVGVVFLLWGLARVLYRLRDTFDFLASGRARAILVGGTAVLAAAAVSLAAAGPFDWTALLGAIGAAIALYMSPEPKPAGA